jgi:hypothetical protein
MKFMIGWMDGCVKMAMGVGRYRMLESESAM